MPCRFPLEELVHQFHLKHKYSQCIEKGYAAMTVIRETEENKTNLHLLWNKRIINF